MRPSRRLREQYVDVRVWLAVGALLWCLVSLRVELFVESLA